MIEPKEDNQEKLVEISSNDERKLPGSKQGEAELCDHNSSSDESTVSQGDREPGSKGISDKLHVSKKRASKSRSRKILLSVIALAVVIPVSVAMIGRMGVFLWDFTFWLDHQHLWSKNAREANFECMFFFDPKKKLDTYVFIGQYNLRNNRIKKARAAFEEAIKIVPKNPQQEGLQAYAYEELAVFAERAGDGERAIEYLEKCTKLIDSAQRRIDYQGFNVFGIIYGCRPFSLESPWFKLGRLYYLEKGDVIKASQNFQESTRLKFMGSDYGMNSISQIMEAEIRMMKETNNQDKLKWYFDWLKLLPINTELRDRTYVLLFEDIGSTLAKHGQYDRAIVFYKRAIEQMEERQEVMEILRVNKIVDELRSKAKVE